MASVAEAAESISFTFGCMYQMDGLFVTQASAFARTYIYFIIALIGCFSCLQYESGIMGLGMTTETIVPSLVSAGKLDHTVRICNFPCFTLRMAL